MGVWSKWMIEQRLGLIGEGRAMALDRPARCPRCGQAVTGNTVIFPAIHLTVAERLVWRELAKAEGAIVAHRTLEQFFGAEIGIAVTICRLRQKTKRIIRNVRGRGYVLEPLAALLPDETEVADAGCI